MTASEGDRSARLLLDTHTFLWMVEGHSRLGEQAGKVLNLAGREDRLLVSAITVWEIALLASKKRIDLHQDALQWVSAALALPGISLAALNPEIAVGSNQLPFAMHGDPADRILVATARQLGATLVTADRALLEMAQKGYFKVLDAEI